ncbi:MAG: GumC family protein [Gammaproteobacteria bacterium]
MMEQIDLQHYLRVLRKHKLLIFLFSFVVTSLAAYYAYSATPIYQSTSTLLIESQGNNLVQFEELVGLDTENQDYYQTQFEILRSRGLAVRVVEHMGLWNHPELSGAARLAEKQALQQDTTLEPRAEKTGIQGYIEKATDFLSGVSDSEGSLSGNQASGIATVLLEPISPEVDSANGSVMPQQNFDATDAFGSSIPIASDMGMSNVDRNLSVERQSVVNSFMSKLTIAPVRRTSLVHISFESENPKFAARVANAVGEQYIESYLDAKLELTTKASTWLNERLADLKGVLEESENRLITFKQANGLVDVDGSVGRLNEQELLLTTAELAQARSDLAAQEDLYREVQLLQGQPLLLDSLPAIQADPLVQGAKIEQGQAQRSLDELRNRYGDRHPRVVDAKSQLATINNTLLGHLDRVSASVSKDFQLARQRVASIESKLASGKQEIQLLGTKKFELDELQREVETNRDIYNTFFSRITEAKSADGLESANARVSDPAVPAITPIKPKKGLIIALAAIASLVLSMLMAILYEQMDDTVKGTSDVEDKLGMKLLGILPLVKGGMFAKARSLPLDPTQIPDRQGRFAESVATIRTAVSLDDGDRPRKVIAITSSVPGEGKSSTSINLAYSMGQLERVLIVDCDMRRPTIAKSAGLDKNVPGLSNLIMRTATARECIKRDVFGGGVDILPSGPIPDQPLELLSSKRFEKIIAQLAKHYDRIIFDCAPTQAVSDALVISRLTDGMIYCVKSHDTSLDLIRRGIQRLKQANANIAGVIITQVDIDKITSYGGDYYYQGYYDYYGYTEKGKKGGKIKLTQSELHAIRNDDGEVELDLNYSDESSLHRKGKNYFEAEDDSLDDAKYDRREKFRNGARTKQTVVKRPSKMRDDLDIL